MAVQLVAIETRRSRTEPRTLTHIHRAPRQNIFTKNLSLIEEKCNYLHLIVLLKFYRHLIICSADDSVRDKQGIKSTLTL